MSRKPELKGRAARLARLFPAGRKQAARTPFVLLVVLLLGGGLIALLVLNSALSEGSFQLDDLQKQTKNLSDEEQALQRDIDAYSAPDALQRRAHELGMVPGGDPAFLNPDGTVRGVPGPAALRQSTTSTIVPLPPEVILRGAPASPARQATPSTPAPASPAPASPIPGSPAFTSPASPTPASTPQPATTTTPGR
ncbi:septum formation initiator family protein [Streptomyces sp. NPDC086549]|uniref:septum formation initiator family protein n=1 Tax=Streptomyces sp. NPDC086549 TaxID=3365752 RepID=UPI003828CEC0